MPSQAEIRKYILSIRKNLHPDDIGIYQQCFDQKITSFIQEQDFTTISAYLAINNEISLEKTIKKILQTERITALPTIQPNGKLIFKKYSKSTLLSKGPFNILEPVKSEIVHYFDAMIIPLIACDKKGNRIGMGGGYYDRYLSTVSSDTIIIGVGWDFQLVEYDIPKQPWDFPLDYFISPNFYIRYKKST